MPAASSLASSLASPAADLPPRERILHAAHALFYGEGIRATGIDKVIAEAQVSKVTFYRQFASKDELVRAYLAYRHDLWMGWLRASLAAHRSQGKAPDQPVQALLATMGAWFGRADFRGCAFLNAAAELGGSAPDILATVRAHKQEMAEAFEGLLPAGRKPAVRAAQAQALALAVDGAIVQAQMGVPVATVLKQLGALIQPLWGA